MKRISSKIVKQLQLIEKDKKSKDLGEQVKHLPYKLVHDEMLKQLKQKLAKIEEEKPTNFIMRMEHAYPEFPNQPKPFALFGKWKGKFKGWALRKISKEKDAIVGEAYYGGLNEQGKKVIKLRILKGKARTKTNKLVRAFRSFIPKAKYVLDFVVPEEGETGSKQEEQTTPQSDSTDILMRKLTQAIIQKRGLINTAVFKQGQQSDEDIKNLEALKKYLAKWFEGYQQLDDEAKAKRQKRKDSFVNLYKQVQALQKIVPDVAKMAKTAAPTFDAAAKAAEYGAEMVDINKYPEYERGYAYIPFTGKSTGKKYEKGDRIDAADRKANYPQFRDGPTWCNQFAMDLADKVLGENNPFDFLPEGKGFTNANELYDFFHEANGVLFTKIGRFETAWEEVRKGKLVYFVSKGKIGHIATGYPTDEKDMKPIQIGNSYDKVGKVVQAGSKTDILFINRVWGGSLKDVAIFSTINNEPSEEQEPNANLYLKMYDKIKDPVGVGGKNYKGDIKVIQQLLVNANKNIGSSGRFENGVDGSLGRNPAGSKTVGAIKEVQQELGLNPTGLVAYGDNTWNYLYNNSKPILDALEINSGSNTTDPNNDDNTGGDTDPQPTGNTIRASVGEGGNNQAADVRTIQQLLVDKGFDLGAYGPNRDGVDGDYGSKTQKGIEDFQRDEGLAVTGLIEPNSDTWLALIGQQQGDGNDDNITPEQVQFQYKGTAKPLNAKAEQVLRDILAKANEPNAVITSTVRTPKEQASIMYNNIVQFGVATNKKFYGQNAVQVVQVYEDQKAAGKSPDEIRQLMTEKINELGPATISKHCDTSNPAIDIHPKSLKNRGNFEGVMTADGRVSFVAPPKDPFYHIEVK